jgi:hypothetical protein
MICDEYVTFSTDKLDDSAQPERRHYLTMFRLHTGPSSGCRQAGSTGSDQAGLVMRLPEVSRLFPDALLGNTCRMVNPRYGIEKGPS